MVYSAVDAMSVSSSSTARPLSSVTASAPPPPLVRLTSLMRLQVELPVSLQPAFAQLSSLHSSLDVALAELDSASSIAHISAQTRHIKGLIAQLQQCLTALQLRVQAEQAARPSAPRSSSSPSAESTDEGEMVYAASLLAQHSALAQSYTNQLRQRILSSRANLAQRSAEVRRQLLTPSHGPSHPSHASSSFPDQRASEFSASLQSTQQLLSSSLQMSTASLTSLSSSTSTLRDVQRQSAVYRGVVKGGSAVITKQMQRQRTDRLLILAGLAFFTLICLYIANKRLRIGRTLSFLSHLIPYPTLFATAPPALHHQQQQQQQQRGQMRGAHDGHRGEL